MRPHGFKPTGNLCLCCHDPAHRYGRHIETLAAQREIEQETDTEEDEFRKRCETVSLLELGHILFSSPAPWKRRIAEEVACRRIGVRLW